MKWVPNFSPDEEAIQIHTVGVGILTIVWGILIQFFGIGLEKRLGRH